MKKLSLLSIEKGEALCITFAKRQEFFAYFHDLFLSLGFDESNAFFRRFGMHVNDKKSNRKPARISAYVDKFESGRAKGIEVDIFYGHKNVQVLFKTSREKQEKILTEIRKFADWPKR